MTEQNQDFPIPESAQRLIDADREAFNEEFDRRQDMGIETAEQTRRALLDQGIGRTMMSATEVEQEEIAKIPRPISRFNAKRKFSKYKSRPRDPKGGGPPPHIAAEIRGELKD